MIARITARHRECAFAGSRTRLLGILTLRPASQLEHSPSRIRQPQASRVELCKSPLNPTDANSHLSALWVRVDKICAHLPLPVAWRAHNPRPWALRSSAALALCLAMPRALATELVFRHRASDCAPKGCGLLFSSLSLFYLFVSFCICL